MIDLETFKELDAKFTQELQEKQREIDNRYEEDFQKQYSNLLSIGNDRKRDIANIRNNLNIQYAPERNKVKNFLEEQYFQDYGGSRSKAEEQSKAYQKELDNQNNEQDQANRQSDKLRGKLNDKAQSKDRGLSR